MFRSPASRIFFALFICLGTWQWQYHVFIPSNTARAVANQRPIGNNSDLYPRWLGTRELLINHRNPYSHEVTREIQAGYYGRPLDPLKPGDPKDQAGFAYPIYVAFFLWPTLQMRFSTLQAASGWVMLGLSALTVPLWAQGLGLRFSRASQLTATLLLFATYGLQQAYAMRQLTLVVAFLVALSCSAIAGDRLVVAGVTLAIATIKPQLAL